MNLEVITATLHHRSDITFKNASNKYSKDKGVKDRLILYGLF